MSTRPTSTERAAAPRPRDEGAIVFYDEDCGFCRWTLAKFLRWDRHRRLRPVPIDSPEGDELLAALDVETRKRSWHLVADGSLVSAGAAFAPILERLAGGTPLARVAARFPRVMLAGYSAVASRRSVWGRMLPRSWVAAADRVIEDRRSSPATSVANRAIANRSNGCR